MELLLQTMRGRFTLAACSSARTEENALQGVTLPVPNGTDVFDGDWHQFAFCYDAATRMHRVWLDGDRCRAGAFPGAGQCAVAADRESGLSGDPALRNGKVMR